MTSLSMDLWTSRWTNKSFSTNRNLLCIQFWNSHWTDMSQDDSVSSLLYLICEFSLSLESRRPHAEVRLRAASSPVSGGVATVCSVAVEAFAEIGLVGILLAWAVTKVASDALAALVLIPACILIVPAL